MKSLADTTSSGTTSSLLVRLERGQGMVEYGLIVGVISIAGLTAILALGPKIAAAFQSASAAFGG